MLYIEIKRNHHLTLSKQVYLAIKSAILEGTLKPNTKLPSSRSLSKSLSISRNVVVESYEQLIAEGYIFSKEGSGTYISQGACYQKQPIEGISQTAPHTTAPHVSTPHTTAPKTDLMYQIPKSMVSFRTGLPNLGSIPIKKWGKLYQELTATINPEILDYQNTRGMYRLRYQLSLYLKRVRGVDAPPENILVTNGAAQAFSILCNLVNINKEYVLVENPISHGIVHTLKSHSIPIKAIPVDKNGLMTEYLPSKPPRLILTTPSHQFPTGVVLPINRRIELINYARKHHAYIVEDDYDSEFRFEGSPIQSMQSLDPSHVVYVGTFSKILSPALRLGYVVMPSSIISVLDNYKYINDLHSPILEQLTMARFIEKGYLDYHIRKTKAIYLRRKTHLSDCLSKAFSDKIIISGDSCGMHLIVSFKNTTFNSKLLEHIKKNLVYITPVNAHYIPSENELPSIKKFCDSSLILGYGNTDIDDITLGVQRLQNALNSFVI